MADSELVRTLDYILNRCDEKSIEAVAQAVVRRRRNLALFGSQHIPNPEEMAKKFASQFSLGTESINAIKQSVREMIVRIIKQEAPDLDENQIQKITEACLPEEDGIAKNKNGKIIPKEYLQSMINEFVAYSEGRMPKDEETGLRNEMGDWPKRYWKSFPPVIRSILKDYLQGECTKKEFKGKLNTALAMSGN
jgi:hypothetical protein